MAGLEFELADYKSAALPTALSWLLYQLKIAFIHKCLQFQNLQLYYDSCTEPLNNKFRHMHLYIVLNFAGCSNGIATVSRMAVSFNLPHITYAGTSDDLGNKQEFSMLSRISYTMDAFAKFYVDVLNVSMNVKYLYFSPLFEPAREIMVLIT